jgi:tetratricopeptide (TPR) repeat protein/tRNA A-37 threonylcarbamoyl transferase component Bud32
MGIAMSISPGEQPAPSAPPADVDAICDVFEAAWYAGQEPRIEDFLPRGDLPQQDVLLRELLLAEWDLRRRHGQDAELETYAVRFPNSRQAITDLRRVWEEMQAQRVFDGPTFDSHLTQAVVVQEMPGTMVGRYKLLEKLGEGGFGVVWAAEQQTPVKRRVALKVIKLGMDSRQVIARFEAERQALALMDHPNIAKVLDAGTTQAGRPYFVMELVKGVPITTYCDEHELTSRQRLQLFIAVCRAVQHAHLQGIIHRDLKPTNILVAEYDHQAVPKVIDFGVAKVLNQTLSEKTIYTHVGQLIGTIDYMSPEQALGSVVSPQSDLYSLGVMLYDIAAGRRPFYGDTALAVISQHVNSRPVAPSWHNPAIHEALDRLILELLAKSPADRPTSATVVADSLEAMLSAPPAEVKLVPARQRTSLDRLAGGVFVGRIQEMTQLREGLDAALAGRGRLFLISGEPGSGKTRLTEELTTFAQMRGADVVLGKSFDGNGAPAFWPWVQAIRRYTHGRRANELYDVMGPGAADIAQLDSDIRQRLPAALPAPLTLEPEPARFRLFDGVTTFLRNAARSRPMLLILDDLQWADEPSLRLLQFLAQEIRDAHLLIVGTYRDVALGRGHPLTRTLAEVGREDLGHQIRLGGLSREEVGRYIELTSGMSPPETLVRRIWDKTEGNPFFVSETIRLLITQGLLENPEECADLQIDIPPRVRDVVRRRLEQLSERCNETLTLAAVYGREFSLEVIEALKDSDRDRVLDDLEEAADARIIAEARGGELSYLFTHDLVREAVCDQVNTARRTRMHAHIARALERLYQGREVEHHLAELARHFLAAGRAADPDRAIDYSVRAGRRSLEQLAYEEAARHFEAAVKVLENKDAPSPPPDQSRLCELLQNLGEAQRRAGQPASLETFQRAFEVARNVGGVGAGDQMALAAIAFEWLTWSINKPDVNSVLLCKEALLALPADRDALRAKLLAAQARALKDLGFTDQAAGLAREAVELARQVRDPSTLCYVLESVLHMSSGPAHIGERLSYAVECLEAARAAGDLEKRMFGTTRWIYALFEAGEIAGVDRAMEELESVVRQIRQPQYTYVQAGFVTMRALLEGRFTEAEQLTLQALTLGQRLQSQSAEGIFGMQMFLLRREQGRLHEVAPIVEMFVKQHSGTAFKPGLALMYAELGLMDKARAVFEELAVNEFARIQQDALWAASITFLVEVCAALGDRDDEVLNWAEALYRLLSPYATYAVVAGEWASFGAGSRFLGQLAATMGRWQEAESHFDHALAMNAAMGAKPWLAHTQFQYARMLLERSTASDIERAKTLLDESETIARQLGMRSLETRIATARRRATV